MFGVLHLHPARCDFQTQRCLELLLKNLGRERSMTSRGVGPGGDYQNLPEAIFRLRRARHDPACIAHAWGPAELMAAAAAGFLRIVFSPQSEIHSTWWTWIEWVLRNHSVEIVCPTRFAVDTFIAHGADAGRCHVVLPAVDVDRLNGINGDLRARLGLASSDLVMLACGESLREAAHDVAVWAAAILHFLDPKNRMLIWGRGPMVDSLKRFSGATSSNGLIVDAENVIGAAVEFEQIARAADMALVCARGAFPVLPLGVCMSAGLPVVAVESPVTRELLRDDVNALVEPSTNPRRLAQRVRDLQNDPRLRLKLVAASRAFGEERFGIDRFIGDWQRIYDRINGFQASPDSSAESNRNLPADHGGIPQNLPQEPGILAMKES